MRILLVVHGYPPWAMGGTEIYTHDLARALHAGGDEVFVLTREADPAREEYAVRVEERNGVRLTVINNTFRSYPSYDEATYRNPAIRAIGARVLDQVRPDIVHVQHLTCLSTRLVSECAARRIPVVFTLNDYWMICHRGQLLNTAHERCEGPYPIGCGQCTGTSPTSRARLDSLARLEHMREVCTGVTRFLVPSNTLRQRFLEFGLSPDRLTLQEQGIDLAGFRDLTRTTSERLRIAFLGGFLVSKAPHMLLEAFDQLPAGSASLHLFGSFAPYHGDDSYRDTMTRALARGGHTHASVSHDRIPEVLAATDVLVVPSIWIENAPFVIREAFAAGVPVVASNLGGMAEMVKDGVNGLLFEVGNAADLRRVLARLIDEPDLLPRLRRGIPQVKSIEEDAAWTRAIYRSTMQDAQRDALAWGAASGPREQPSFTWRHWLAICVLILLGALVSARSVATERGFPYWDFAFYEDQVIAVADHARTSIPDAWGFIRASLSDDYNRLFTIPLVPWTLAFGDSRFVYILAVFFTYFVPFALLAGVLATRAAPRHPHIAVVAVAAALLTPATWSHVLQGYPDIGGATLLLACVLLYGRWVERGGMRAPIAIGLLAALSVLFRRHYVYGVAALYGAMALDRMFSALSGVDGRPAGASLRRAVPGVLISGAVTAVAIVVASPEFVTRALSNQGQFAAYQQTIGGVLISMVATVGTVPLMLAVAGWWMWRRNPGLDRPELRLVAAATVIWAAVWVVHSRQQPYHYPHWLPLFVVTGVTLMWAAWDQVANTAGRMARRATLVAALLAAWLFSMPLLSWERPNVMRWRAFPDVVQRSTNPAYDSIVELTALLRDSAAPGDAVLVAASSPVLNDDVVRSAEKRLFGRRNAALRVTRNQQIDDGTHVPTDDLLHAGIVVVARPPQVSLGADRQKVVTVLVEAFDKRWPIADDFEPLARFPLPADGEIEVYKRRAPTAAPVAADTARRIDQYVLGRVFSDGVWTVDSVLPSAVTRNADGTVRIQTHPVRARDGKPTTVTLIGFSSDAARVDGALTFFDTRCRGVELFVVKNGTVDQSLGSFSPASTRSAFSLSAADLKNQPLSLMVQGPPESREDIDFCTVALDALSVRPLP